jgi:6-phosphogluconolactonase
LKAYAYHWILWAGFFLIACHTTAPNPETEKERLYVGTYSVRNSEGVYVYAFDRKKHSFELIATATGPDSPSFLDISPDGQFLYSANRQGIGTDSLSGSVSAYQIHPASGNLQLLNEASSYGLSPCHIFADESHLYLSHYAGGSITVLSLAKDGSIASLVDTVQHTGHGPHKNQQTAHMHSIQTIPGTDLFLAADLGMDLLTFYQIGENGVQQASMAPIKTEPGTGPRHFTFSKDGQYLYVAEELSSSVSLYELDLEQEQTRFMQRLSTLPSDYDGQNSVADIHLSPDGKFLYVSNRGHESLAIYQVNPNDGRLAFIGHQSVLGKTPRNFLIDPKGTFLLVANENTDEIIFFDRDLETGLLQDSGVRISVPSPVSLQWLHLGAAEL